MTSRNRVERLMCEKKRQQLAEALTERIIGGAPRGIILMQLRELARLTPKQLHALNKIQGFPLEDKVKKKILRAFDGDETMIDRLELRSIAVRRMINLRAEGRFELMEKLIMFCFSTTDQKTVSMTEMRRRFYEVIDDVAAGQVYVVTKRGKPIVVVVPYYGELENGYSVPFDPKQKGES